MTDVEELADIEMLADEITQIKEKVQNSPSWKELTSDAQFRDVVEMLVEELKQYRIAHFEEYKLLLKEKEKKPKCEELKCLISLVKLREKEIEALAPKVR